MKSCVEVCPVTGHCIPVDLKATLRIISPLSDHICTIPITWPRMFSYDLFAILVNFWIFFFILRRRWETSEGRWKNTADRQEGKSRKRRAPEWKPCHTQNAYTCTVFRSCACVYAASEWIAGGTDNRNIITLVKYFRRLGNSTTNCKKQSRVLCFLLHTWLSLSSSSPSSPNHQDG